MKSCIKFICFLIFILVSVKTSYCQTGFYKNYLGVQGPGHWNVPLASSLDQMKDGGYILTTTDQINNYVSYLRLDPNYSKKWVTNYAISNTGFLDRAVELDDKGFVGIYMYDNANSCFTKQDASGHPLFSNYYHTATSTNFSTSAICKSASNDSGFVVMYTGCELHYGIAKFSKTGDVQWCYDYSANGYHAGTYELIQGIRTGYLTVGHHTNSTLNHEGAVVAQFNNDGTLLRAKEYILDSTRDSYMDNPLAAVDNHYYTIGNTLKGAPTYATDRWIYLSQLDTSLNLIKSWKVQLADANRMIWVENILSLSDSTIVICGKTTDTLQGASKAFILRFNPKGSGNIMWAKSWESPNITTSPIAHCETGLFAYGQNEYLVTTLYANYDGSTVASMDKMGNGLCNATDVAMTMNAHNGFYGYDAPLFQLSIPLIKYPMTMTEVTMPYSDTLLCGKMPKSTGIQEIGTSETDLVLATQINNGITLQNLIDKSLEIEIYTITGQIVNHISIAPFTSFQQTVNAKGMYMIRARSNDLQQTKKVMVD